MVRGGGGITPDVIVPAPEENWKLRDACFEFVRQLVGGGVPGFPEYKLAKTNSAYQLRGNEYSINDLLVSAFRQFVRERPHLRAPEARLSEYTDYIRRRLRAELITAAYGLEASEQFLIESDQQALRAVAELPKAKLLSERARLFLPAATPRN